MLITIDRTKDLFSMFEFDDFYQILFEISNEYRYKILLQLKQKPMNITQISNTLNLRLPEVSRHLSRLSEVGLTFKEPNGLFHISNYCKLVLNQVKDLEFITKHKKYFNTHTTAGIPPEFMKRIGDLDDSSYMYNAINFLHSVEKIIDESEEYVWFIGDEYIINASHHINEAAKRDVAFRIIEPENYVSSLEQDSLDLMFSNLNYSSTLEKMALKTINVFLYVSEKMAAIAFPLEDTRFDYLGFTATDKSSIQWCKDLFLFYWGQAKPRSIVSATDRRRSRQKIEEPSRGKIIIEGANDPTSDFKIVQDAVDHYDEVILKGVFNFGSQGIVVSRSCNIRGEGRDEDIPLTKIYKSKWQIPFTTDEWLIRSKGVDIDVTIENIHFTDFNGTCIEAYGGNNITLRNNRITLETGYARGRRHHYGDMVVGIHVGKFGEPEPNVKYYPGKVVIEGNYIDFALSYIRGGYIPRSVQWDDLAYHPNLVEEYYPGAGVFINHVEGFVKVQDNVIKNMNALGINASDCMDSAEVHIKNNLVASDIYGAHAHGEPEAGCGITAHSAASFRDRHGFKINISNNTIKCTKPSYVGIRVSGPFNAPLGSDKFKEGYVGENNIHLDNGYVGIKVGRSDNIEVSKNIITGKVYYGIKVQAKGRPTDEIFYSEKNSIKNNDMTRLTIKNPDGYSNDYADGIIFSGIKGKAKTAHIWLDEHTIKSDIKLRKDETLIDEGKNNSTAFVDGHTNQSTI